jgi:hypothetical protein
MQLSAHERIVMGIELESYTIALPEYRISRELAFPRPGVGEKGERFTRDDSIGTEYNSRPFNTIREGLFLLRAGLRKYSVKLYRQKNETRKGRQLLLVGGWRDRYAGCHIHMSVAEEELEIDRAKRLAWHLHDHIPFFIALGANSPVWQEELNHVAANRIVRASKIYFRPISRRALRTKPFDEMLFSPGRKTKPPTIELRVLDSNIPDYVMAIATLVKAAALAWLRGKGAPNKLVHADYLKARDNGAHLGMRAKLCWNGAWMPATTYLDRFIWAYREELGEMEIPEDVWTTLKLLKRGYNGSRILREAAQKAYDEHPQTWQRRFAGRYVNAIDKLLAGNSILDFVTELGLEPPNLDDVWLGRARLKLQ